MTAAPPSAGPRRPGSVSRPLTLLALASGLVLLTVLGLAARITPESPVTRVPSFLLTPPPGPPPAAQTAQSLPPLPPQQPSPVGQTLASALEVLLAVAVLALVAALVLVVVLVARALARRERPAGIEDGEPSVVDLAQIGELLARSRSEIDIEGEVNQAIVRCWRGLEALAADAGVPRVAHQTAREYTVAVLTGARLPSAPAEQLADLYEGALFSGQQLPEETKRVALQALTELRAAAEEQAAEMSAAQEQEPQEQEPGEQAPGEQTPREQAPGEQAQGDQAPGQQPPGEERR